MATNNRSIGSSGAEDLWSRLAREKSASQSDSSVVNTANNVNIQVVFVGDQGCGKSTLLQSFLKPTAASSKDYKPTIALDYNYARKTANGIKSVAHMWEVGGDLLEPRLLEIPLTRTAILTAAVVVICCDLSKPHNCVVSVLQSISAVREVLKKRSAEIQASNVTALQELRDRISEAYKGHPDAAKVKPTEIPMLIVANKSDAMRAMPLLERKAIIQMLRFIAHYYCASLLTTSSSDASSKETYRSVMSAMAFGSTPKPAFEIDVEKSFVYITRSRDNFSDILLTGMSEVSTENSGGRSKVGINGTRNLSVIYF